MGWTGREARALRLARRMSVRAYASHLGVTVATVSNWDSRRHLARLRTETQQLLDIDLARAADEVRERFAALTRAPSSTGAAETAEDQERLAYAMAHPSSLDLVTVAHLREQIQRLDADYDRVPSAALLGAAGQRHGQIMALRGGATNSRARRDLLAAEAESATLMGQLVWDASQRRDHEAALATSIKP